MKNITKESGETLRLKCEITGDPIPRYRWFRGDPYGGDTVVVPIDDHDRRFNVKATHWGSR